MLNDWCPQHNQPLKACLGPEVEAFVAPELAKLQDLQDQLFVKDQVLKAQVNAGEDAATVTKYCLGPEVEAFVAPELAKLQDLQDQLFVKDQVLKAQVNAGEDAATVTKYANDVNKARRDIRNFVVDLKTKVHKMASDHKAGAQASPKK